MFFRVIADDRYPLELGHGRLANHRKKNNAWKHYSSMLGEPVTEARFLGQTACFSCSLNRRITRPTFKRSIPWAFHDKSTFHLSKHGLGNTSVSIPDQIPSVRLHRICFSQLIFVFVCLCARNQVFFFSLSSSLLSSPPPSLSPNLGGVYELPYVIERLLLIFMMLHHIIWRENNYFISMDFMEQILGYHFDSSLMTIYVFF